MPSQCSPSNGSSAKISAQVKVGGGAIGLFRFSRYSFAKTSVLGDGGSERASYRSSMR